MLPREDSAHWVGGIDDVDKRGLISDQTCSMLEIYLEVLLLLESITDSLSLHGWAKVLIIRIPDFRNKYLVALIAQGHQNGQQAHIHSMVDVNVPNI